MAETLKERRRRLRTEGKCICCQVPTNNAAQCERCSELARVRNRRYTVKNKEKRKTRRKAYYADGKYAQKMRDYKRNYRLKKRKEVIHLLGGKCTCCGEDCFEFLQIDHVNKDGKKHRTEAGRSLSLMRDILKNPNKYNLRILCGNCHNAITAYGRCPHERKISQNIPPSLESGL